MGRMAEEPASRFLSPDDDLYCIGCGYNLRGLTGDPRRCPECGRENSLESLLLPAAQINRQLRRLESAPTRCFAAVLLVSIGLWMTLAPSRRALPFASLGLITVGAGLIIWLLSARAFAQSCLHCPQWKSALWHFHLYAIGIFAAAHAALFGSCFVSVNAFGGARSLLSSPPVAVLLAISAWTLMIVVIQRLYRRLRRELAPLQRSVAVEMYVRERAAARGSDEA